MKIENDKSNALTHQTDSVTATPAPASQGASKAAAPSSKTDQLTLSSEAQLLKAAADAASDDPAVRADLVERMRALLADGKIGHDATRLAESLIDDVLNNR